MANESIKTMLHWAVGRKLITTNPLRGLKIGKAEIRATYFSDEIRQALFDHASPALGIALRAMIRTGARPGELCNLQTKHVEVSANGMRWLLPPELCKTKRKRIIYCVDKITIDVVTARLPLGGYVFRTPQGAPWTPSYLKTHFNQLCTKLEKQGVVKFEDHHRLYSCRHTFAKDCLIGRYSKPIGIHTLSELMGNDPSICEQYYATWEESETNHLWAAVKPV